MLALLATLLTTVPPMFAVQDAASADVDVTIAASDPQLGERGTSTTVHHRVLATGTLHVWAASQTLDPYLRVEIGGGRGALEDDNWGGGTSAWVAAQVKAGDDVAIVVASNAHEGAGAVRVGIRELPETETTLAVAEKVRNAVKDAVKLRNDQHKHDEARARLKAALDSALATPGAATSSEIIVASLRVLEDAYHLNDYDTCTRAARFRCDAMTRAWPPDCKELQEARIQLGELLGEVGDTSAGIALCESALAVYRRTLPAASREIYAAGFALAQLRQKALDFDGAADLMRDSLAGLEGIAQPNDKQLIIARISYGAVLNELGLLDDARAIQEQALAQVGTYFAADDPIRWSVENNLAATLSAMGDHQAALAMYEPLLAVQIASLPPDDGDLLSTRMNMGVQFLALGRPERARELFEEVVSRSRNVPTWGVTEITRARTNLAIAYDDLGQSAHSLALIQPVLDDPAWKLADDPDREWRVLVQLAVANNGVGRGAEALAHAERGLARITAFYPPDAQDIFDTQNLVAKIALKSGDRTRAFELATTAAQGSKAFFARCATTLATRQAAAVQMNWSRLVSDALGLLSAAADDEHRAQGVALSLELVESARGIDGATLRLTRELAGGPARAEVEERRTALRRVAREIAHYFGRPGAEQELRASLAEKEKQERALKSLLAKSAGSGAKLIDPDARSIAAALPAHEAAISFWSYEDRGSTLSQHVRQPRKLAAFVVRADKPPLRIELGSVDALRKACESWRTALLGDDLAAARAAGGEVSKIVIEPLRATLGDARVWHVALDDALHLVPLDALPEGDNCLGDRVRIVATPTLAELTLTPMAAQGAQMLVALGGIDYDHAPDEHAPRKRLIASASVTTDGLRSGARGELEPLWETSDEIAAVSKLFKSRKSAGDAEVELLEERYATKSALFALAPRARFLHIATHGFFAPETVPAIGDRAAQIGFDPLASQDTMLSAAAFAPLALCGLALSGANLPTTDPHSDEAIATAEELASLDLSNCELVVLSACDTNVGFMRAGQGIASFQKALQAAGAHSVVTSLWKVRDEATRELMSAFYRALWVDGVASKSEALWRAKFELRARRAPPRDWAGWVLSGDG